LYRGVDAASNLPFLNNGGNLQDDMNRVPNTSSLTFGQQFGHLHCYLNIAPLLKLFPAFPL